MTWSVLEAHLIGRVEAQEAIQADERLFSNWTAVHSPFTRYDCEQLLKRALEGEYLLYVCAPRAERTHEGDRFCDTVSECASPGTSPRTCPHNLPTIVQCSHHARRRVGRRQEARLHVPPPCVKQDGQ